MRASGSSLEMPSVSSGDLNKATAVCKDDGVLRTAGSSRTLWSGVVCAVPTTTIAPSYFKESRCDRHGGACLEFREGEVKRMRSSAWTAVPCDLRHSRLICDRTGYQAMRDGAGGVQEARVQAEAVTAKLHWHIMAPFCLLTVLNHMDRANLGEAPPDPLALGLGGEQVACA